MSDFERRDFLKGAAAFAAGVTAALTSRHADAGSPSFMNNVPDPLLTGKELPTFKFALEKSRGKVIDGNTAKEATVEQLPISKGIAGVSMGLQPGGMRELHWHATAAEWAFVNKGRVRTTVLGPYDQAQINDYEPGDVWYFPRGHGHMLECLGDEPCHFILIFDNGYFSEFGTFSITDWIGHAAPALLAKNFRLPEATFKDFPRKEVYFADGQVPPAKTPPTHGPTAAAPQTHKYRLLANDPHIDNKGGKLWLVDARNFPISKTITGAVLELEPGALRELHWHPTADEWQYVLEGKMSMTMFGSHGRYRTEVLEQGDVGYMPQGYGHSIENVGDKPCRILIGFNSGSYEDIDLSAWIAANPVDVLATNFGQPAALFEKFPRKDVFISDGKGSGAKSP
ncbi:MAG: cupin domain-containing protein [Gemmataceae bacterium]